jgi:hypothetical protein
MKDIRKAEKGSPGSETTIKKVVIVFLIVVSPRLFAQTTKFDVVVYGGTSAGITAAIQVAKMGKKVAILEPGEHIGGMATEGLGGTDIDNHREFQNSPAVGGLALEFYRRVAKAYNRLDAFDNGLKAKTKNTQLWRFESKVAEKVYNEWIGEYRIPVFYNHQLSEEANSVVKKGAKITQIKLENGAVFQAQVFIDATFEGDLLHFAGVSTVIGREANQKYGETKNGIRAETTHAQFAVRVDPYVVAGQPKSGVIPTIQDEPLGVAGAGDHRLQAYCFRVCLTQNLENQLPFYQPNQYDPKQYEIYLRYEKAGGKLYTPSVSIPNGKTDLGAWHDLSHNLYGMNFGYPAGNYATRKRILEQHCDFTQGLFYFLANDSAVSETTRQAWRKWGYAKDEFTDNRGFPRKFYVRDARRMVADEVMTEHHVRKDNPKLVADPVAVAFWPPDTHSVRRIIKDGYAYNEGFVFGGNDWQPFGVSYRSLIPKKTECTNLLTPTCPSSSHVAYGAIRIEFTFMALGQATGVAAVLAIDKRRAVQSIEYAVLKKILLGEKQVISLAR